MGLRSGPLLPSILAMFQERQGLLYLLLLLLNILMPLDLGRRGQFGILAWVLGMSPIWRKGNKLWDVLLELQQLLGLQPSLGIILYAALYGRQHSHGDGGTI
jgi:hypothetical protein